MIVLIFNSILLGVGLAMDAFSVSLANGLAEPKMKGSRMMQIAGTFAVFQALMPLIGWAIVSVAKEAFWVVSIVIPYAAFIILFIIGGKMILDSIKIEHEGVEPTPVSWKNLIIQGIATSIDALSVGFVISDYAALDAVLASVIIGIVTLGICVAGIFIGRKLGTKLAGKASVLGGVILIAIGIEILIKGLVG